MLIMSDCNFLISILQNLTEQMIVFIMFLYNLDSEGSDVLNILVVMQNIAKPIRFVV